MFLMCNDGGFTKKAHQSRLAKTQSPSEPPTLDHSPLDQATTLNQRLFVYELLASGIPVTSLDSADFHDAKVSGLPFEIFAN
jgi:hypothetical protein